MTRFHALVAALCLVLAGQMAAQQVAPLKPVSLTEADLQKLKWIEGSWRGTGGGMPPFFERYRFENPTALVVESLEGEKVTSTSRYTLQKGEFSSGTDAARTVATVFDGTSVTFEFVTRSRGSFKWQRENANAWKAILTFPAAGNRPAGERVYLLERTK
jgi:hypothetical protein